MQGVVCGKHARWARYAVRTDTGYVVLDVEAGAMAPGDVLQGDLRCHGSVSLQNQTSGGTVQARIEAFDASREAAESLLR